MLTRNRVVAIDNALDLVSAGRTRADQGGDHMPTPQSHHIVSSSLHTFQDHFNLFFRLSSLSAAGTIPLHCHYTPRWNVGAAGIYSHCCFLHELCLPLMTWRQGRATQMSVLDA